MEKTKVRFKEETLGATKRLYKDLQQAQQREV